MRMISVWFFVLGMTVSAAGQSPQLASEHAELTGACKRVRGHAQRIVEEASQSALNQDIAKAHAAEVASSLKTMEQRLKNSRKLLTAKQVQLVAKEHDALEAVCASLQELCARIEEELGRADPDRIQIRNWAVELRKQMGEGNQTHAQLKKKLNIR